MAETSELENRLPTPVKLMKVKATESKKPFDVKCEMLKNIVETVQCYRCKSVPGFHGFEQFIYNCVRKGHSLCENCKKINCPCKSKVGESPNPVIKQMLKDLPAYCPNFRTGCRNIFVNSESRENHRQYYEEVMKDKQKSTHFD